VTAFLLPIISAEAAALEALFTDEDLENRATMVIVGLGLEATLFVLSVYSSAFIFPLYQFLANLFPSTFYGAPGVLLASICGFIPLFGVAIWFLHIRE